MKKSLNLVRDLFASRNSPKSLYPCISSQKDVPFSPLKSRKLPAQGIHFYPKQMKKIARKVREKLNSPYLAGANPFKPEPLCTMDGYFGSVWEVKTSHSCFPSACAQYIYRMGALTRCRNLMWVQSYV